MASFVQILLGRGAWLKIVRIIIEMEACNGMFVKSKLNL